jgi:hypothetical protein
LVSAEKQQEAMQMDVGAEPARYRPEAGEK